MAIKQLVDVARGLRRPSGTQGVAGLRRVPQQEGDFSLPGDTGQDTWDLDPNEDGDLVIPDDIQGRDSDEPPEVGGSDFISFNLRSVGDGDIDNITNAQDITLRVEWYDDESGSNLIAYDDENDDAIFGPSNLIRMDLFVVSDYVKIIISSDAGGGTTNRLVGTINAH